MNTQRLEEVFIPVDIEAIHNISTSQVHQKNFWAWHYEKNGVFTVRSAYRTQVLWSLLLLLLAVAGLKETKRREDWIEKKSVLLAANGAGWKRLWGVKLPPILRTFAWRLAR